MELPLQIPNFIGSSSCYLFALVSVTFGVRQVFGLFLVPISIEIGVA